MILDFKCDLTPNDMVQQKPYFPHVFFPFTLSTRCNLTVTESVSKDKMVTWDHVILRHGKPMAEL